MFPGTLRPIEIQSRARNRRPVLPVGNEGNSVAVELAELADLRDEKGTLLVDPAVLAIPGERFYLL
jgi:hypothetical protein